MSQKQVRLAYGWGNVNWGTAQRAGGVSIQAPGAPLFKAWIAQLPGTTPAQRDAGLRKSSTIPQTGFLVKGPHHTNRAILRLLCCSVILCKAACGPSLTLCKWEQWQECWRRSSHKYSLLLPGTQWASYGSLQIVQKAFLDPATVRS